MMFKLNSMKKMVVGGTLVFAAIALVTTGFASWIVGTNITKKQDEIGITVDTAVNESVTLDATITPGESFYLGETGVSASPDNVVHTQDGEAADFDVIFSEVKIQCGTSYYNKHFANNTSFDLQLKVDVSPELETKQINVAPKNEVSTDKVGLREGSPWTYIDLTTKTQTITPVAGPSKNAWDVSKSIKTITLSDVKFTFGWGTFFGADGPAAYYNSIYSQIKNNLEKIQAIEDELDAMKAAFDAGEGNTAVIPFVLELVPQNIV